MYEINKDYIIIGGVIIYIFGYFIFDYKLNNLDCTYNEKIYNLSIQINNLKFKNIEFIKNKYKKKINNLLIQNNKLKIKNKK